jgi:hypothetical protein
MHAAFAGPAADVEADMDLDAADAGDPAQVAEYAADIYAHFKSEELTKSAKHGYMASQSDINEKVRAARGARAQGGEARWARRRLREQARGRNARHRRSPPRPPPPARRRSRPHRCALS